MTFHLQAFVIDHFLRHIGLGSDTGLEITIRLQTGTGGDQFTDDDVFLQTNQMVNLTLDCGIGQNLGGFLEGCGRQEGVRSQRCLGNTPGLLPGQVDSLLPTHLGSPE